jgi:hypothetical protein
MHAAATNGSVQSTVLFVNLLQNAPANAQKQPKARPVRKKRSFLFGIDPTAARAILQAEGRWPRRPYWWDRSEASHDTLLIAAFQEFFDDQPLFESLMGTYLR